MSNVQLVTSPRNTDLVQSDTANRLIEQILERSWQRPCVLGAEINTASATAMAPRSDTTRACRWSPSSSGSGLKFGSLIEAVATTGWVGAWWLLGGTAIVAAGQWPPVGIVGFLLVGWGMALVWASLHHQELTVVPERSATVSSIVSVLAAFGAFTPALAGLVADRAGLPWSRVTFVGFALVLVVVMWSMRRGGPKSVVENGPLRPQRPDSCRSQ